MSDTPETPSLLPCPDEMFGAMARRYFNLPITATVQAVRETLYRASLAYFTRPASQGTTRPEPSEDEVAALTKLLGPDHEGWISGYGLDVARLLLRSGYRLSASLPGAERADWRNRGECRLMLEDVWHWLSLWSGALNGVDQKAVKLAHRTASDKLHELLDAVAALPGAAGGTDRKLTSDEQATLLDKVTEVISDLTYPAALGGACFDRASNVVALDILNLIDPLNFPDEGNLFKRASLSSGDGT